LVDIMPTILDMTGLETPVAAQGESLTGLFDPDATAAARFVYSEAFYARLHFGWSELFAVQDQRHKLIMSSDPELYDLLEDPDEADDLARSDTALFDRLEAVAEEMVAEISRNSLATETAIVDEETLSKLASLGYLGGASTSAARADLLASPREKIDVYNKTNRARELMYQADYEGAERLFREVLSDNPGVLDVYRSLGQLYEIERRWAEAEEVYRLAIPLTPQDPYAYILLAQTQLDRGLTAEAETTLLDALDFVEPSADIYCTLGDINRTQADYREAVGYFGNCARLNPASAAAHAGMAAVYLQVGQRDRAEQSARSAVAIDDSIAGAHFILAQIHEAAGRSMPAAYEYIQELRYSPADTNARFNLAVIYRVAGKTAHEERHLIRILEIDPEHPRALLFLGMHYLNRSKRYERAVELVTAAVAKPMENRELALGYLLLADLYERLGDPIRSAEYGRRGRALPGR
jgi:tetratricopeptide (TPR) repeat protein